MHEKRPRWMRILWIAPLAILGIAAFIFIGGGVVMQLWNWLLPPLFGWQQITFWQAFGLLALCRILFGGFGMHGGPRHRHRGRCGDRIADRIVERVAERYDSMTPEERERFRERVRARFGFAPNPGESSAH